MLDEQEVVLAEIMAERPTGDWTPHRKRVARLLAAETVKAQAAQEQLATAPMVTHNGRGNPVPNPLFRILASAMQNVCAYRRTLAIHARALGGDPADIARRRAIRLEQQRNAPTDRELIAWPSKENDDDRRH